MGRAKLLKCDCGCQNWYKSRETIRRHRLKSVFNSRSQNSYILADKMDKKPDDQPMPNKMPNNRDDHIIQKVDLRGAFEAVSEKINPKSDEPKYHCGSCGHKMDEVPNYCPSCGARLK